MYIENWAIKMHIARKIIEKIIINKSIASKVYYKTVLNDFSENYTVQDFNRNLKLIDSL